MPSGREKSLIILLLAAALSLRAGLLWTRSGNLVDDRDAYLAIAQGLVDGNGYSNAVTGEPTAFRPPLYPILLAGILALGGKSASIAMLHLIVGTATVFLTWNLGRRLGLGNAAIIAAVLVAVDPLLLQYTALPMTETIFTFLLTALIAAIVHDSRQGCVSLTASGAITQTDRAETDLQTAVSLRRRLLIGLLFGLCALCRPTVWAIAVPAAVWLIGKSIADGLVPRRVWSRSWPMLLTVALVVFPWFVRNLILFHEPIFTTTHGGYTLLLGNNSVFYHEVVEKPWGTVWEDAPQDRQQQTWFEDLKRQTDETLGRDASEFQRDRYLYGLAFSNIKDEPGLFVRACLLRFFRFWNIVPQGSARETVPRIVLWGIGLFYGLISIGFLLGLVRMKGAEWPEWMPVLLPIAGFCLVHLFFWTNLRMRAPVVPLIALLTARGIVRRSGL